MSALRRIGANDRSWDRTAGKGLQSAVRNNVTPRLRLTHCVPSMRRDERPSRMKPMSALDCGGHRSIPNAIVAELPHGVEPDRKAFALAEEARR
jgi:hypothetical protein